MGLGVCGMDKRAHLHTMMVHSKDATVAYATVVGAVWFVLAATPLAEPTVTAFLSLKRCLNLNWLSAGVVFNVYPLRCIRN